MNPTRLILIASVLALMTFSAVLHAGMSDITDADLWSRIAWMAGGVATMLAVSRVDYRTWCRHAPIFLIAALALMLLVSIPGLGVRVDGTHAFRFGAGAVRPVALLELALILFLASWRTRTATTKSYTGILLVLTVALAALGASVQFEVSASILLLATGLTLVAVRGHGGIALATAATWLVGATWLLMRNPNRVARILMFFSPQSDVCSRPLYGLAHDAGGWTGAGLGRGTVLRCVPGAAHEFIAAQIGEELGTVGLLVVLAVFAALLAAGFLATYRVEDSRARLLGTGIVSLIAFQTLLHVGVLLEGFPLRAPPLPFLNTSGTDLLVLCAATGILLNIARSTGMTVK